MPPRRGSQGRSWRRPGLMFLTAVTVIVALAVSAAGSAQAMSPQKADMAELMQSFNTSGTNQGLIGNSWWQAAVALSTLETYQQATGDSSYSYAIAAAFDDNQHKLFGNFEDPWNDDTGWWGLAWLQAYDITHSRRYLQMAETDANYMHQSWDNTCGGGVWWDVAKTYKNAIANEIFLELTAWLHNTIPGDSKYLSWARAEWSWFKSSGMISPTSHLINDGLQNCANNQEPTWTYNQGVILAGLAQLYTATKDAALLTEAESIAKAAISHLTVGGVVYEQCVDCTAGTFDDVESFQGIFVRDLKVLAVTARTNQFNSFFIRQSKAIRTYDTNARHQIGLHWSGPITDLDSYCQASGVEALVAALRLP
jgi:predicted alpha-1,6-mannanase (GH76 family)